LNIIKRKLNLKKSEYKEHESLIFPTKQIKSIQLPLISFDTEFKNKTIEKKIYKYLNFE